MTRGYSGANLYEMRGGRSFEPAFLKGDYAFRKLQSKVEIRRCPYINLSISPFRIRTFKARSSIRPSTHYRCYCLLLTTLGLKEPAPLFF